MHDRFDLSSTAAYQHVLGAFRGGGYGARDVWDITFPVIVDTVFLTIVGLGNTGIISVNGAAAVAAVNTANTLHWLMFGTFNAIALGATVLVSQYFGAGGHRAIRRVSAASLQAMIAITVVYSSLVFAFERPLLGLLFGSADAQVLRFVQVFLLGLLVSYPLRGFYLCVSGLLRGIGKTRITLALSLVANGSNLLLNFLFVVVFHWGMEGLAAATALSQAIGAAMGVGLMVVFGKLLGFRWSDLLTVRFGDIRRVLHVSLPFILEDLFFNGGKLIIQMFIVPFGTLQIAANGIINAWNQLQETPVRALGLALVPIAGASVGRGDYGYARKITRTFIITGMLSATVAGALLVPLFPWAIDVYFHAPAEIHGTLWMLFLFALFGYPLLFPFQAMLPATLRAAGDGNYTTIASLASMWIYRIGVGYLVSTVLGYQIVGLWFVWVTEWGVRALLFYIRYRGTAWTRHRLVERTDGDKAEAGAVADQETR